MKKFLIIIFILLPITVYGASFTLATYPINVNGQAISAQPYNSNGVTFLPLRAISEALGVPITWDKDHVDIDTLDTKKLAESCVMIYGDDGVTADQGSGVYIGYDDILSTNHIATDNDKFYTSNGSNLTIDDSDANLDVIVFHTLKEVKPVKIGDSDSVKVNDKVFIISSPQGKGNTVIQTTVKEIDMASDYGIVLNGTTFGGSSGGAIFSSNGELIGIVKAAGTSTILMIPINNIRKTL